MYFLVLIKKSSGLGNEKTVKLLIKDGANVNAANKYGKTALMMAAKNGNFKSSNSISD